MARICDITGKKVMAGNNVSHSNKKTKRKFYPNLQTKKFFIPESGEWITLKVSTNALRTIDKKGITACYHLLYKNNPRDYVTYGKVYVYDENNSLISQFDCGVSPGTIVFDIRNTTSITDYLTAEKESKSYYDMSGRKLNSIENQPKGVYIQSGKKVFKK